MTDLITKIQNQIRVWGHDTNESACRRCNIQRLLDEYYKIRAEAPEPESSLIPKHTKIIVG